MKYVLVCAGSTGAPQLEVNVAAEHQEEALEKAMDYSEKISNRYYWIFSLNEDGRPIISWRTSLEPTIKNVINHVRETA